MSNKPYNFIDRTGEVGYNNQGLKMTIIAYRKYSDIDVMFEDGIIVNNKSYVNFKKGAIKYPTKSRVGETNITNQGLKITIIAYRKAIDLDVQFEDGIIVKNRAYKDFKKGIIKHPIRYEDSFAYYVIEELGIDLDSIWNWELNNKNNINPYEIYKSSKTKVWLYCQEHDYHNYNREGNKVGYEIQCSNFFYNEQRCSYCARKKLHYKDSLAYNYPQVARMIAIPENNLTFEDCFEIACKSNKKFYFKCLDCGAVSSNQLKLNNIANKGYSCEYCSDGFSVPEKFMANVLNQLNIKFQTQLNKSDFNWCKDYRYDFYIPSLNMIIETHGLQHYEERSRGRSLEQEQANDKYKKHLAKKNRIKRYYSIDCRYSEFKYMKNNIIKTLNHLFDLSNIDWKLAWEECQKSKCVECWELWNKGFSIMKIAKKTNLGRITIREYLKRGAECGKCDYTKEKSRMNRTGKKVVCITTNKIFNTATEGAKQYKMKSSRHISECCSGKRKSCGKLSDGTPLVWMYYEDYLKLNNNDNKIA